MSTPPPMPPPLPVEKPAPTPEKTLQRLFLTLFLRGRSSRGLRKETTPKSLGSKLALTLGFYGLFGLFAFVFVGRPVFALSVYLHAMTLVFLGMFVAASAGEILFNTEEADILMHRPVTARALLWAKISVLVKVSIWLAGAFNLVGLFVGISAKDGSWLFPLAHAASTVFEALFCTGCIVLMYQLCLRWFGRERLEGLMTLAQVLVSIGAVLIGQLAPRLIGRYGDKLNLDMHSWWISLLPPAWFAGFDDAIAGSGSGVSWALAGFGIVATTVVLWLAFGKLAHDYESGLRTLNEARATKPRQGRRRWVGIIVKQPPLRWLLRDPVSRASFVLVTSYLFRDRDVKLRVYPGVAPMLVVPIIMLFQSPDRSLGGQTFSVAFAGSFLGLVPLVALDLLRYSQQWRAGDIFRVAPMHGPAPLSHGTRLAVLIFLTIPLILLFGLVACIMKTDVSRLLLLLPGIIMLPIYAMIPSLSGSSAPLSLPTEEAKSTGRSVNMIGVMVFSMALAGLSAWTWSRGGFKWLLIAETGIVAVLYTILQATLQKRPWTSIE